MTGNRELGILGRKTSLFDLDVNMLGSELRGLVSNARFLVIGGGGSIGQAVVKEIFSRNPAVLHVVDISENSLVELVRDIRSSSGYIEGEFQTFAIDALSKIFDTFYQQQKRYDYVLNLSALKHVRSEGDPFTLMRLIEVNVLLTEKLLELAKSSSVTKFFCVSTDKATNPVSMMGCSKRIMELILFGENGELSVSTARFANVAFSDGSLLHGFQQRIEKSQPLSAPSDVRRYFITKQESGILCLASCLLGRDREIFFPKLDSRLDLLTFSEIAIRYLHNLGLEPLVCKSEDEARSHPAIRKGGGKWPVYFFESDTTGEKPAEEFFESNAIVDTNRFDGMGVISSPKTQIENSVQTFVERIIAIKGKGEWTKKELLQEFIRVVPEFHHLETGRNLISKM